LIVIVGSIIMEAGPQTKPVSRGPNSDNYGEDNDRTYRALCIWGRSARVEIISRPPSRWFHPSSDFPNGADPDSGGIMTNRSAPRRRGRVSSRLLIATVAAAAFAALYAFSPRMTSRDIVVNAKGVDCHRSCRGHPTAANRSTPTESRDLPLHDSQLKDAGDGIVPWASRPRTT